jgi:hypothetical protein
MNIIFPTTPRLRFNYEKNLVFNTMVKRSAGRQEYRATYWPSSPLWEITFPFKGLRHSDMMVLGGFLAVVRGALHSFYFRDVAPEISGLPLVQGIYNPALPVYDPQAFLGDGVTKDFQLFRNWNYWYLEYPAFPPFPPTGYGAGGQDYGGQGLGVPLWETPYIYLDGILQTEGYSISQMGLVSFDAAPGYDALLTAEYGFYYKCRLKEDYGKFSNYQALRWSLEGLTLVTEDN